MSALQIESTTAVTTTATTTATEGHRVRLVALAITVSVAAAVFGVAVVTAVGHGGAIAWGAIVGLSGTGVLVMLLALFAVGTYLGHRERREHTPAEQFDVR